MGRGFLCLVCSAVVFKEYSGWIPWLQRLDCEGQTTWKIYFICCFWRRNKLFFLETWK